MISQELCFFGYVPGEALRGANAERETVPVTGGRHFEGEFSGVTDSYAGKGVVHYAW
jgi:hypothetical protein